MVLSVVQTGWCPIQVQILPLSLLLTVNCTLDVAVLVGGLPVRVIGDDPSHVHVIVASGLPPFMSHVRIIVEFSFIGPGGVCIIDGVDDGSSEIITGSRSIIIFRVFNLCQHFEISYSRYAIKHFITGVYISITDSYR